MRIPAGNFTPFPVFASFKKFFQPQPLFDAQKSTNNTEPRGRILLDTIKSSRSMMFVPSPKICIPDHGPKPRIAGIERMITRTIFTITAFLRLHPHRSMAKDRIFSNTATTVDRAAHAIKRKNNAPQSLPPIIWLNTFGSVINTSPGPAPGSTLNAKHAGIMIMPAISATKVSSTRILRLSPASVRSFFI